MRTLKWFRELILSNLGWKLLALATAVVILGDGGDGTGAFHFRHGAAGVQRIYRRAWKSVRSRDFGGAGAARPCRASWCAASATRCGRRWC